MLRVFFCAALLLQDVPAQRIPEPDAESQKATLKQIKDLFKDEYTRRTPSDQVDLARKLIKTGTDSTVDMNTKYVCFTEARDLAVSASDATVAMEAVTLIGKSFLIAVPAAKMAILAKLATGAKDPEKIRTLARSYYELAKDSVTSEDYDTATAAAGKADTLGRALKDVSLSDRIAELKKDLTTLKSEYQKVKASLDNPGSGDADLVGRYMCFVRNEWTSGLKLLSESGKTPLKELAAKDLANPETTDAQAEVGDGWWQQAQAEKMLWKKTNILSRARKWYEAAQPNATALVKVRVNKRLAEMEGVTSGSPGGSGVNLLQLIDPKRDAVHGEWSMDDGVLIDRGEQTLALQIPYQPPEEYDLSVSVKRVGGTDSVSVGIVIAGTQAVICVDGYPTNGQWLSGFEMLEGKILRDQASPAYRGKQLIEGDKPSLILIQVRKNSLSLTINGKKIGTLEGVAGKLSNRADSGMPDPKALFIGGWNGKMGFTDIRITPLSGPGKRTK